MRVDRKRASGVLSSLVLITGVLTTGTAPSVAAGAPSGSASASGKWAQFHDGADRTGYQADETTIGLNDVGTLTLSRIFSSSAGGMSAPLIAGGRVYSDNAGHLTVFDAGATSGCAGSPSTCDPLWRANTAYFDGMAISGGRVFVTDAEGVQAFDAAGVTGCGGSPKVCTPLWATSTRTADGPGFTPGPGSPVVSDGVLYVPGYGDGLSPGAGGAYVAAFDTAGVRHCTGSPSVCGPIWTTVGVPASRANQGSPAVADGIVYLNNGGLLAFDAAGCPQPTCAPRWIGTVPDGDALAAPAVANATVYLGSSSGRLYAFDAAGSKGCAEASGVTTCTALWTATAANAVGGTPAVANGSVYVVSGNGTLTAFDAAGVKRCSRATTAKTCLALWSSDAGASGYVTASSPAVANGLVYFSSTNGGTYAYDAAGVHGCTTSAATTTCQPRWGAVSGYIGGGSPAVAGGIVYINLTTVGQLYAYHPVPRRPAAPKSATAVPGSTTASTGSLSVGYTLGYDNGTAITSQTATCVSSDGGATGTGTRAGPTAGTITVGSLRTGRTYTCTVTATNGRGTSAPSTATPAVIVGAPGRPTAVTATQTASGRLAVAFTPGPADGSAITGYSATCTSGSGGVTGTGAGPASPVSVSGLSAGAAYTCRASATNARGAGPPSSASAAVTA